MPSKQNIGTLILEARPDVGGIGAVRLSLIEQGYNPHALALHTGVLFSCEDGTSLFESVRQDSTRLAQAGISIKSAFGSAENEEAFAVSTRGRGLADITLYRDSATGGIIIRAAELNIDLAVPMHEFADSRAGQEFLNALFGTAEGIKRKRVHSVLTCPESVTEVIVEGNYPLVDVIAKPNCQVVIKPGADIGEVQAGHVIDERGMTRPLPPGVADAAREAMRSVSTSSTQLPGHPASPSPIRIEPGDGSIEKK